MKRNIREASLGCAIVVVVSLLGSPRAWGDSADEAKLQAIRAAGDAYLAAIEEGDIDTLRSMWTPEGDYVDAAGVVHKGRDLFRTTPERPSAPQESTAASNGAATPKWDSTLRLVTPTVAIEDGILRNLVEEDGSVLSRRFTAIWVHREGRWLLDGLRESTVAGCVVKSQLRDLDWMIGEWAGKSGETEMLISAHYSEDGNFLVRTSMVRAPSGDVLTGTERIGWDAKNRVLKSHAFDSTGSTSEAAWRKVDDRWVVESSIVMPNGQPLTTRCSYQSTGPQNFLWTVAESQAGAEKLPSQQVEFRRAAEE